MSGGELETVSSGAGGARARAVVMRRWCRSLKGCAGASAAIPSRAIAADLAACRPGTPRSLMPA